MNIRPRKFFFFFALSSLMASLAIAASFVVPTDALMIDHADSIVVARVISSHSEPDDLVGIVTVTEFSIERILKGRGLDPAAPLRVTELGGVLDGRFAMVDGTPQFTVGQRALLFLEQTSQGRWRTVNMTLGRFHFVSDTAGNRLLIRDLGDSPTWDAEGADHVERARTEAGFIEYIQARQRGEIQPPSYFVDLPSSEIESLKIGTMATRTAYLMTSGFGFRWPTPNQTYLRNGTVPGLDAEGSVNAGIGFWNGAAGSNVAMSYGGTTSSTSPNCAPPCIDSPGQNNVVFGDPHMIVDGIFGGSGTVGIGIVYGGSPTYTLDGETFHPIVEGHVVMNDGLSSANFSQAKLNHALAHELGHTLGFRHSNEGVPTTTDAVMNSSIGVVFTSLRPYDLEAVGTVYGAGAPPPPPCTPPSITAQPQSQTINSGQSANLSVAATGTAPLSFQWFRGNSGNTSQPVGTNSPSFNTGALTTTTSYWVRVTGQCAPNANSITATITVNSGPPPCNQPTIFSHPASQTIQSGQSATLTVIASGTGTLTYQWFRGASGDVSQPQGGVTASNTFNTGPLTATTSFWVRVFDSCGSSSNSGTATITIAATPPPCEPVQITTHPLSQSVTTGQSATLSVAASGTQPFTIQWYRGETGDFSQPIAGATTQSINVTPSVTTKYWVQLKNACNSAGANSATATITVSAPCPAGHLCLFNGRFRLALFARDPRTGAEGTGQPVPENDVFGFFSLATLTGDTRIPEVFVKIIDATSLPGAKFWIFHGGLTDLEYTLVVTDTKNNGQKIYTKAAGSFCGGVDLEAFTLVEAPELDLMPALSESFSIQPEFTCGTNSLCLLTTRFDVSLTARDPRTNRTGVGRPVQKNDLFGYFSLVDLTGDQRNPEVFVKMIDATGPFGAFWLFHGGLTDLEYNIRVRDNVRGTIKNYAKAAGSFCGSADTNAFPP